MKVKSILSGVEKITPDSLLEKLEGKKHKSLFGRLEAGKKAKEKEMKAWGDIKKMKAKSLLGNW